MTTAKVKKGKKRKTGRVTVVIEQINGTRIEIESAPFSKPHYALRWLFWLVSLMAGTQTRHEEPKP